VSFFISTNEHDRCIIAITTLATSPKTQDIVEKALMDLHSAIPQDADASADDFEDVLLDSEVPFPIDHFSKPQQKTSIK
jgi:hypothetical protein